jgi:hypothetical protein
LTREIIQDIKNKLFPRLIEEEQIEDVEVEFYKE